MGALAMLAPVQECGSPATWSAAAAWLVLSFIDLQRAPVHVVPVQILDCARRLGARHFHEAEAARLTGVAILDQGDRLDRAVLREQGANRLFARGKGQIAHVDFAHAIDSLVKCEETQDESPKLRQVR